jgi:cell division protein FtsB
MATLKQRDDPMRLFVRRLGLLGLFLLVIFTGWSVWGASRKDRESAALNQESQAALADLSAQETQLQGNIATLESDRGREATLRQEYAVGKPGENLVVIVDPATTTPAPPAPTLFDKIKSAFLWW